MKRLVAICLILTMCLGMGYALAETVEFTFFLTSRGEVDVGYPAEKSDSEQRFYVTETFGAKVESWFGVRDSKGRRITSPIHMKVGHSTTSPYRSNYTETAYAGRKYELAAQLESTDSVGDWDNEICLAGRWTP